MTEEQQRAAAWARDHIAGLRAVEARRRQLAGNPVARAGLEARTAAVRRSPRPTDIPFPPDSEQAA